MNRESNWLLTLSRRLTIACIIAGSILLLWRFSSLPPLVPLWYSKPWGTDRLAHPLWLGLLPAGSLVIFLINFFAGRRLPPEMLIFTQLFAITALLVAVLSLVTLTKILFLVS